MLPYREDGVLTPAKQIDAQSQGNDSGTSSFDDTKISAIYSSSANSDLDSDEDEVVFLPRGLRFKQQAAAMKLEQERKQQQRLKQKQSPVQHPSPVSKVVEPAEKSVENAVIEVEDGAGADVEKADEGHIQEQELSVSKVKEVRNLQPTVEDEIPEPFPVIQQVELNKPELPIANYEATAILKSAVDSKAEENVQVPVEEQELPLPVTISSAPAPKTMVSPNAPSAKGGVRSPTKPRGPKAFNQSRASNRRSSSPPAGPSMQPFVPGMQIDPNSFSRGPASGYVNITMQQGANRVQNQYQYQPFKHWHAGRGNANNGHKRRGGARGKAEHAIGGAPKAEFFRNDHDTERGGMMGSRARGGGKLWIP
ncbi:MAG: hypothetical protein M1829_001242 [Trizodia sp. TS-e1964]|nr:MAG: hypothetical protein M1829_001242 [Trizodia sp. TS-e1964]